MNNNTQRIGASVPFPGAAMNDDVQASNQRADEEAAALAKAAAEAERKVSLTTQFGVAHWPQQHSAN